MPYYERNLPHWLPAGKHLFVTWRLYGSLPAVTVTTLRKTDDLKDGKRFRFIDQELDGAAFGPVCLRDPRMAKIVWREQRRPWRQHCVRSMLLW